MQSVMRPIPETNRIIYITGSQHSGTTLLNIILGGHSWQQPYFPLDYEELSLYPDELVPLLSKWLQLEYEPHLLAPSPRHSYVVHGNRMREQADKYRGIRYDNRWFYRSEWMLPYLLPARTRELNTRLVYHNETGHLWNQ
jgi:hypothetical protein